MKNLFLMGMCVYCIPIVLIVVVFSCGRESVTSTLPVEISKLTYDHLQGQWVNDVGNVYRFTNSDSVHQVEWRFYRGADSNGFWGEYWIDGEYLAMKGDDVVFYTTKTLRYPNIHFFVVRLAKVSEDTILTRTEIERDFLADLWDLDLSKFEDAEEYKNMSLVQFNATLELIKMLNVSSDTTKLVNTLLYTKME